MLPVARADGTSLWHCCNDLATHTCRPMLFATSLQYCHRVYMILESWAECKSYGVLELIFLSSVA